MKGTYVVENEEFSFCEWKKIQIEKQHNKFDTKFAGGFQEVEVVPCS